MDKKFMNKMDDMELDMVAGGKLDGMELDMVAGGKLDGMELDMVAGRGFFNTLKEATKSIVKPAAKTLKKLIEADIDAMGYDRVKKLVDKLSKKVIPPQWG